jgi:hypothetical protein
MMITSGNGLCLMGNKVTAGTRIAGLFFKKSQVSGLAIARGIMGKIVLFFQGILRGSVSTSRITGISRSIARMKVSLSSPGLLTLITYQPQAPA